MAKRDLDMTVGTPWRLMLAFAAPMFLGLLFQQMYNTVDTLVVGKFIGSEALAATGSTSQILNLLVGLFMGLSMGANVIISQYYGAHDGKNVHDALHTTITVTVIISVILTIVGYILTPYMLRWMRVPDNVMENASIYLKIYFVGLSGLMLYNMGSGALRAVGDSKRPLYFLIFSAVLNTVLDLLFVVAFHWGVPGVAWATTISQIISAVLVLFTLARSDGSYKLVPRDLGINTKLLKQIFMIGFPSSIQMGLTSFSNVFVQSYVNSFGSDFMAAYSAFSKIDSVAILPAQALANANTTFVGQNMGAGQVKRARGGVRTAMSMAVLCTVVMVLPLMIFSRPIFVLFNDEAQVIAHGITLMRVISPFYIVNCINQVYSGALRGAGKTKVPMVITLSSFVLFRQIYLAVISRIFPGNSLLIVFGYPAGWMVCTIIMFIYYRSARWDTGTLTGVKQES